MAERTHQKVLRIGIIQGGKIVEERVVRSRQDVTLGSGSKNTFVVPASSLPRRFKLFEVKGGSYFLSFNSKMTGRVSAGNGVVDLESLKSQRLAKKSGDLFRYALPETSRGKVTLGDVTLLFQFVAPPPEPPKIMLPKEARGGWVKSIDKFFTTILLISVVLHVSSGVYLYGVPVREGRSIEEMPDRFAKLIVPEMEESEPPPSDGPGSKEDDREPEAKKDSSEEEQPERTEEEIRKAASSEEVQDAVRDQGILKLLGSKGVSGAGPGIQDLLSSGGSAGDLDEALARAGGVRAAQEGEDIRGPAGGDGDRRSDIGDLATKGAGEVERKGRGETRIRGALRQGNIEADTATVDSEQLGRFIRSRQQAIQACYENELRRNPQLRGRLLVHIVIGRTGRVSAIDFLEDTVGSTAVLNCVRSRIRTWSFPVRPPEETPISVPFIFTPAG